MNKILKFFLLGVAGVAIILLAVVIYASLGGGQ